MGHLIMNGGVFDDDGDDDDNVVRLARRPYNLPERATVNDWDYVDFFQRFRITKRTFLVVIQLVAPALHHRNPR